MKDDSDDRYDLDKLRLDPTKFTTPYVPAKVRKRREQFVQVPMWWYERLTGNPTATGSIILVAIYLAPLQWKHYGKPFKLPNGMLKYDGISRYTKWRALNELERLGLITVERRRRRSPIIHVQLEQP
jgi:hypothetical protein